MCVLLLLSEWLHKQQCSVSSCFIRLFYSDLFFEVCVVRVASWILHLLLSLLYNCVCVCVILLGRKECEEEERQAREDIERLRLAEAAQMQQEEKQRQVFQEWVGLNLYVSISTAVFATCKCSVVMCLVRFVCPCCLCSTFESLDLETSFLLCRNIFRISRSTLHIGLRSRSRDQKRHISTHSHGLKGSLVWHIWEQYEYHSRWQG